MNGIHGFLRECPKTKFLLLCYISVRRCFNQFLRITADYLGSKQWRKIKSTHQRVIIVIIDEFVRPKDEFLLKGYIFFKDNHQVQIK